MKKLTKFIIALSISAVLLAPITPVHAGATVTLDGILSTGEYTGADSGKIELLWYNDHHSIYTEAAGNKNDMYWEIDDTGSDYSLNIFFEVPTYARRMIWKDGVEYDGTNFDASWGIGKEYLDAYLAGSHHGTVKMDYNTQTGSEYFQLNAGSSVLKKVKWQDEDSNLNNEFNWKTSREYLIVETDATTELCLEFDMTASIEMEWIFDLEGEAEVFRDSITDMQLHLSDEGIGLPPIPPAVPAPGAFLLGSIGVACVGWMKRRKSP